MLNELRSFARKASPPPVTAKRGKGRPTGAALRWNLQQAAREYGVHRESLEKRRRALNIDPGPDGCFSTREIANMIYGDKEAETIGKLAAERRNIEMKNEMMAGELIPTAVAAKLGQVFLVPVRQKILASSLPDAERSEMLEDLVRFGELDWTQEATNAAR